MRLGPYFLRVWGLLPADLQTAVTRGAIFEQWLKLLTVHGVTIRAANTCFGGDVLRGYRSLLVAYSLVAHRELFMKLQRLNLAGEAGVGQVAGCAVTVDTIMLRICVHGCEVGI